MWTFPFDQTHLCLPDFAFTHLNFALLSLAVEGFASDPVPPLCSEQQWPNQTMDTSSIKAELEILRKKYNGK